MKYTKLGKSDLNVSRICMGCMGFGDAKRKMERVQGNWINKVDVCPAVFIQ